MLSIYLIFVILTFIIGLIPFIDEETQDIREDSRYNLDTIMFLIFIWLVLSTIFPLTLLTFLLKWRYKAK